MSQNENTLAYDPSGYRIYKIDAGTGIVIHAIADQLTEEHGFSLGLAHDGTNLWISIYGSDEIWRLDPATGEVAARGEPSSG